MADEVFVGGVWVDGVEKRPTFGGSLADKVTPFE